MYVCVVVTVLVDICMYVLLLPYELICMYVLLLPYELICVYVLLLPYELIYVCMCCCYRMTHKQQR